MPQVSRRRTRKLLFQKLYSESFSHVENESFFESFVDNVHDFDIDQNYLKEMFDLIINNETLLLGLVHKYAPKFDLEKMNTMYVLPIFIWATEMLLLKEEIPAKVSINESVEIAKAFWDNSAKKIVNGVLNRIFEDYDSIKDNLEVSQDIKFSLFKKQ